MNSYSTTPEERIKELGRENAALRQTIATLQAAKPVKLDAPDGPGWWAFEGSEWGQKRVGCSKGEADGYEDGEWDEGDEPNGYYFKYEAELAPPFGTVLLVRQAKKGESFSSRFCFGPYDGNGELGYIMTNHPWNNALNGLDKLVGKWTRLHMPWETVDATPAADPEGVVWEPVRFDKTISDYEEVMAYYALQINRFNDLHEKPPMAICQRRPHAQQVQEGVGDE